MNEVDQWFSNFLDSGPLYTFFFFFTLLKIEDLKEFLFMWVLSRPVYVKN